MGLAEAILQKAEKEAKEIVRAARAERDSKVAEAKKEAEIQIREMTERLEKELAETEKILKIRTKVRIKKEKLAQKKELIDELKASLMERLRTDEQLFKIIIENGKKRFKNPVLRAGKGYEKLAKKHWKGKIEIADIDGIEIGENGRWIVGTLPEIVETFLEEKYNEIVRRVFGEAS